MSSGLTVRHVHSLLCNESLPHLVSSHGSPLLLASCYLLSASHGFVFLSLSVASSLLDVLLEENLSYLLTTPCLTCKSWNAVCVCRVKLHLPCMGLRCRALALCI